MSYVHCSECDWGQDDFWGWRYNPLRWFLTQTLPWLAKPRFMTGSPFEIPEYLAGRRMHTWEMLLREAAIRWRVFRRQHWWTRKAWIRACGEGYGGCPECDAQVWED